MTPILVLAVVMAFLSGLLVVPLWRRFVRLAAPPLDFACDRARTAIFLRLAIFCPRRLCLRESGRFSTPAFNPSRLRRAMWQRTQD